MIWERHQGTSSGGGVTPANLSSRKGMFRTVSARHGVGWRLVAKKRLPADVLASSGYQEAKLRAGPSNIDFIVAIAGP